MLQVQELVGAGQTHTFSTLDELCARYPWVRAYQPASLEDAARVLSESASVLLPLAQLAKSEPLRKALPQEDQEAPRRSLTAFDAVRWLAGKPAASSDAERQMLWLEDGDAVGAALRLYGEPVDDQHRGAVRAWLRALTEKVDKKDTSRGKSSQSEPLSPKNVAGDAPAAGEVSRAAQTGRLRRTDRDLYAAGQSGTWLLSADPEKLAPRAVTFQKIAEAWGLGHFFRPVGAVQIDDAPYLAELRCPRGFESLAELEQDTAGFARLVLAPLLSAGVIHRWAALDYLLGNGDRLDGTVYVDPDSSAAYLCGNERAFAENFRPADDKRSFLPCYMRVWGPARWNSLIPAEKRAQWPGASVLDGELSEWLLGLLEEPVKLACSERGLDPLPVLARLGALRAASAEMGFGRALARAWCG